MAEKKICFADQAPVWKKNTSNVNKVHLNNSLILDPWAGLL